MAQSGPFAGLSDEIASVVARVGASVVRVDDGTRLTACGIVYNGEGAIVATSHGVERDEDLSVETGDGRRLEAVLLGRDPDTDVAVLKVAGAGLPEIERADAISVKVGSLALAIGRPSSRGLEATLGLLTARIDTATAGKPSYVVHTDATLFPGFSGGALIDARGRLVGMLNLLFGRGRGTAIGVPVVDHAVESILRFGTVKRGFLGVRTQVVPLPEVLKTLPGVGQENGLVVVGVEEGGPASQGGILLGDTLVAVGASRLDDVEALRSALRAQTAGETIRLTVIRGGEVRDLHVTLGSAS